MLFRSEAYRYKHVPQSVLTFRMGDSTAQPLEQVDSIAQWVNDRRSEGPTLVHCQAGLNRSSLIVARALILAEQCTPQEAVDLLRRKRSPACLCNKAFEAWVLGTDGEV